MNEVFSSSVDVAVVGAGVVGLACALSVQRARPDRRVLVLGESAQAGQMVTLTPNSVEFLESLGVQVRARANAVHQMRVFSASELSFDAADSGLAALAWVIEQADLQSQLEALLGRQGISRVAKRLDSLGAATPAGRKLSLRGEGFDIAASLAIAADGAQSHLRNLAGIECEQYAYPQRAVVAQLEVAGAATDCAYQWFGPHGVLALLPMTGKRFCMVWSAPERSDRHLLPRLLEGSGAVGNDGGSLLAEVNAVIGGEFAATHLIAPVQSFPLARLRPTRLIAERIALVGDAAHVVHPLAGQGLNLGLGDAQALSEVLRDLPSAADVGEAIVLRRYARARAEPVALMLNLTHGLQRAFEANVPEAGANATMLARIWGFARELGWRGVNQIQPLKQAMIRHASQ
jgi:2-polyprenylphenol 6-hydroxylase